MWFIYISRKQLTAFNCFTGQWNKLRFTVSWHIWLLSTKKTIFMPWFWKQKGKKCILKVYLTQINSTCVNLFDSWENVCFVEQKIQFLKSTVYWQRFTCSIFCHFTEQWFPFGHSTIQCWLVECCRNGCPSGRFSQLQRALWEWTLGFLITYWLGLFYPNCSDWLGNQL